MNWSIKNIRFINQWKSLYEFRKTDNINWADFTIINFGLEIASYPNLGKAVEFNIMLLGIGILIETYKLPKNS